MVPSDKNLGETIFDPVFAPVTCYSLARPLSFPEVSTIVSPYPSFRVPLFRCPLWGLILWR